MMMCGSTLGRTGPALALLLSGCITIQVDVKLPPHAHGPGGSHDEGVEVEEETKEVPELDGSVSTGPAVRDVHCEPPALLELASIPIRVPRHPPNS